ncbi:glycosyltransferase family 4 protein [Bacteroidota bacterium]
MIRKKINILHISPAFNYSCGVSKHVYLLLKELSEIENIQLFFITNKGDSIDRLEKLNVRVSFLNFKKRTGNPMRFLSNYLLLKKFCFEHKIDVIHTHHRYPELLAYFISKKIDIKTVSTIHSFVKRFKNISFKSDVLIAVSKSIEKHLIDMYNIRKDKIIQLYNFIEPIDQNDIREVEELRNKLRIKIDDRILLFIGRIGKIKGCDVLISAFELLLKKFDNLKLIMIGSFESDELEPKVVSNNKIIYIYPTANIKPYYDICDLVVLPSRVDPFPYVMLECGLARKPFIGGRTGGIEEFIEDGVNGLLVEPGNVNELVRSITSCLIESDKLNVHKENLYKKVKTLPSSVDYINFLLKIYYNLMEI